MTGPNAEAWRERIRKYGESFRFFPATLSGATDPRAVDGSERDGRIYNEALLPEGAKAWFGEVETDVVDDDGNILYPKGSTQFTCLPDECRPQRLDRIVATNQEQAAREIVKRSGGDADRFSHPYVASIQSVRQGVMVYVVDEDYETTETGLAWLGENRPEASYAVEYCYHPLFYFAMPISQPFKDGNGIYMPMDGILTAKKPTGD